MQGNGGSRLQEEAHGDSLQRPDALRAPQRSEGVNGLAVLVRRVFGCALRCEELLHHTLVPEVTRSTVVLGELCNFLQYLNTACKRQVTCSLVF